MSKSPCSFNPLPYSLKVFGCVKAAREASSRLALWMPAFFRVHRIWRREEPSSPKPGAASGWQQVRKLRKREKRFRRGNVGKQVSLPVQKLLTGAGSRSRRTKAARCRPLRLQGRRPCLPAIPAWPGRVVVHDHTRMDMPGDGPLLVIVRGDFVAEAAVGGYDTFGVRRHLVAFEIEADFDFALRVDAPPYAVGILEAGFRSCSYS